MTFFLSTLCFSLKKQSPVKSFSRLRMMSSSSLRAINVLVPVADGSEEIETSTIVDTLVRGGAVRAIN